MRKRKVQSEVETMRTKRPRLENQRRQHAKKFDEIKNQSQIKRLEAKTTRLSTQNEALRQQVKWLQEQVLQRLPAVADPPPDPVVPEEGPEQPHLPEDQDMHEEQPVEQRQDVPDGPPPDEQAEQQLMVPDKQEEDKVEQKNNKWKIKATYSLAVPRHLIVRASAAAKSNIDESILKEKVHVPIRVAQPPDAKDGDLQANRLVAADLYLVCRANKGNMAKQVKMHVSVPNRTEAAVQGIKSRITNLLTLEGIQQLASALRTRSRAAKTREKHTRRANRGLVWLAKTVLPCMATIDQIQEFCRALQLPE